MIANPPVDLDTPAIEKPYEFRRQPMTEVLPEDLALANATATLVLHTDFTSSKLFGTTSITSELEASSSLTPASSAPEITPSPTAAETAASPDQVLTSRAERENRTRLRLLSRMYARKDLALENEDQARLDIASARVAALLPRVTATDFENLASRVEKLGSIEARLAARRAARKS